MCLDLGHTTSLFQTSNEVIHIVKLHHLKNSRAPLKKKLTKNMETQKN